MPIYLLDDTLKVEIFVEPADKEFHDNICFSIEDSCPLDEKLFCADKVNMYLTARQARQLGLTLIEAAAKSSDLSEP